MLNKESTKHTLEGQPLKPPSNAASGSGMDVLDGARNKSTAARI